MPLAIRNREENHSARAGLSDESGHRGCRVLEVHFLQSTDTGAYQMPENVNQKEVALDYCFIRKQGEPEAQTVLILKDRASRALRA